MDAAKLKRKKSVEKIIHFVTQAETTELQREAIDTAKSLHPDWEIRHWGDHDKVGRLAVYLDRCMTGAQRADLIRLDALHEHGGIYLDSDILLKRPLDFLLDNMCFVGCSENGQLLTNAFIAAPSHSPVINSLIVQHLENEPDWGIPPNFTTGPHFFSRQLRYCEDMEILPRETFYPFTGVSKKRTVHRLSYGVHEWAATWKAESNYDSFSKHRIDNVEKRSWKQNLAFWLSRRINQILEYEKKSMVSPSSYVVGEAVCVRTIHDFILFCDGADLSLTPSLSTRGSFELPEELFLRRILKSGDWFIDVGANVGLFSMLAAKVVGPFGRVLAFEPNPKLTSLFRKAMMANWFHDRVKLKEIAVSEKRGESMLRFNSERLGDGRLADVEPSRSESLTRSVVGDHSQVAVTMERLDEIIHHPVPIKALKIDVEGHEPAVINGARKLFEAQAFDYLIVEANHESPDVVHAMREALLFVESCGYEAGSLDREGNFIPDIDVKAALARSLGNNLVFKVKSDAIS